eukprot:1495362-Pyramimonas_sp.AAC.3
MQSWRFNFERITSLRHIMDSAHSLEQLASRYLQLPSLICAVRAHKEGAIMYHLDVGADINDLLNRACGAWCTDTSSDRSR